MSSGKLPTDRPIEIESTDRWVGGKSEGELLADLKVYLARLRDNPHSLVDRLRVAAIQLRLGRVQEALVHYEGVLRGYVAEGQIMSAIALCQRILGIYPQLDRIQRILAALYARMPHGATSMPTPVSPLQRPLEERTTTTFVAEGEGEAVGEVMESVFPERRSSPLERPRGRDLLASSDDLRPTTPYPAQSRGGRPSRPSPIDEHLLPPVDEDAPTRAAGTEETVTPGRGQARPLAPTEPPLPATQPPPSSTERARRPPSREPPILLTHPKDRSGAHPRPDHDDPDDDAGGPVVLLTKKKPR
jgi:hypothetical protein